jgi:signal peptidase
MTAKLRHALGKTVSTLVLVAIFALAGILLLPAALGYKRYVITTGSMTGTIDAGSVVFDKVVPVSDLEKGDIITYGPPHTAHAPSKLVTHRIFSVRHTQDGRIAIRTKGDANDSPDVWEFMPQKPMLTRVDAHLPYVGYAFSELNTRKGRMLVFAIPGILIALSVLAGVWHEAGVDARRQRELAQTS